MVIVRAVELQDLEQLCQLVAQATYGMTTLQLNHEQLRERVELSDFAFRRTTEKPLGEPYVLVMEDQVSQQLVGISCIFSKTGGYEPFYTYRRVQETHHSELLNQTQEIESLQLERIHDGPTEIGSLFLLPEFRGKGRGRLLSLSRFAFMAAHPSRFADSVIAEMRGVMSETGQSPFWEAVGRHFFNMDFPQADSLSTINKRFIEDLMPHHPIYTCLLPDPARNVLGEVHPLTRPALSMLEAEGFTKTDLIDIFDGGPAIQCERDQINAVQRTRTHQVVDIQPQIDGDSIIVTSEAGAFRALIGSVKQTTQGIILTTENAKHLQVDIGDRVRTLTLYPDPTITEKGDK